MKEKSKKITKLKQILFLVLVLLIARMAMYIVGNGNISSLEGYLYSLAATATASDATSCNATSSNATSSNATSSNATSSNATSSNATSSNATSSNATSSNAQNSCATSSNAVVPNQNKPTTSVQTTTTEKESTTNNKKTEENKTEEIVENKTEEIVDGVYDNLDLTDAIISNIEKDEKSQSIIIDATKKSTIDSKLFEAMKGKNQELIIKYNDNEIVFAGKDIINAKEIDVALTINKISNNSEMSRLINQDGLLVEFMPNGELPGKATIKLNLNDDLKNKLEDKNYIYLYNEEANNFSLITSKLNTSTDDLYEFVLDHNSKYIIVNEVISEELLDTYEEKEDTLLVPVLTPPEPGEEKDVVSFLESHRTYVIIIVFSILAIIIIAFIIFIDKKGIEKRKKQAEAQKKTEEKPEEK